MNLRVAHIGFINTKKTRYRVSKGDYLWFENTQEDEIAATKGRFWESYREIRHLFSYHLVWNMDQSGFKYKVSNVHTLSYEEERDTCIN